MTSLFRRGQGAKSDGAESAHAESRLVHVAAQRKAPELVEVTDANGAAQGAGVGSLKDGERKSGKARKTTGQHRAHYK